MQFRILGDVGVVGDDGTVTAITAHKPRALLALLILNANRVMSYPALAAGLWGDEQPESPYAALQVVVSRLRSRLGPYGGRVQAEGGGYRLAVGAGETDLLVAQTLLEEGRAALECDDAARAAAVFERALALWSGDALEDLADLPFGGDAARRLRELWLSVVEARNDAVLRDGRHLEVLAGIDALVAAEPLREHLRAQQVAALYRAGRQAEALRACEALRSALRDELGVEPSVEMVTLERRVLDQDATLLPVDAGFMTPLPAWTMDVLPFVGREAEYEQVLACLAEAIDDGIRYVLVHGVPGVGKSRFLLQISRRLARDAIVLPIHVHDVFSPALYAFARVLAEATLRVSDEELRVIVADLADVPQDVSAIRAVASALAVGKPAERLLRQEDLLRGTARWIAALSAKAPVVLVIDDFDMAGSALLHVIWQLSTITSPKRILVVGSTRAVGPASLPLARVSSALDQRGVLHQISLGALDASEIDEMLEHMDVARRPGLADVLEELTGGNAFLLAEALSMESPEHFVEQWTCPPRVRDVARQRTAELGRAAAELLNLAALFEKDFTVETLAGAAGAREAIVATLVDKAVKAHVLKPSTLTSYSFAHQLFRHAIVADQPAAERAAGHRRIACALERVGARPALLAIHWSGASGRDVPAKVARYARAAGRESLRLFEPNDAVEWFELALAQVPHDPDRATVLVELAEAQQLAGDPRGDANMHEAARIALATHDDDLAAQIIRATPPGWVTLFRIRDADTHRLFERASEIVDDDATRSRALASRAIDLAGIDPEAAERLAEESIALARKSNDRAALFEALLRRCSLARSPHTLEARQLALHEMRRMGSPETDVATRAFVLNAAIVAAMQAGDFADVDLLGAEADVLADSYDVAGMRWSAMVRRAWRAGLAGRFERAEELIQRARDFGNDRSISGASETALFQLGLLRWQQGRIAHTLPAVRAAFDRWGTSLPGLALRLARTMVEFEECHDEARALLGKLAITSFDDLRRGPFWSTGLVLTAETACLLGDRELSALVRDQLTPFADQVAFAGTWVTAPIAYGVGVAMVGCGDPDADRMLAQAAGVADRLRSPDLAARARELPFLRR